MFSLSPVPNDDDEGLCELPFTEPPIMTERKNLATAKETVYSSPSPTGCRRGMISGPPLYETNWRERKLCCKMCTKNLNVQFHPQAVVARTRNKTCCFWLPSSKSTLVIPRYKLTEVETGSGPRRLELWVYIVVIAAIILIVAGSSRSDCDDDYESSISYYIPSSNTDCNLSGAGICMIIFGSLLLVIVLVFLIMRRRKDHWYTLKHYSRCHLFPCLVCASYAQLECEEKPDEEFLYEYVYDAIEQTNDLQFLHRFSHLNRAGLMDPIRERHTPNELKTMNQLNNSGVPDDTSSQNNDCSSTSGTERDAELA